MLLSLINDLLVQLRRRQLVMGETLAQNCKQSRTSRISDNWGQLHSISCYLIALFFSLGNIWFCISTDRANPDLLM